MLDKTWTNIRHSSKICPTFVRSPILYQHPKLTTPALIRSVGISTCNICTHSHLSAIVEPNAEADDEAKDDDGGDDYADDDCHVDALARVGGGGEIDVF